MLKKNRLIGGSPQYEMYLFTERIMRALNFKIFTNTVKAVCFFSLAFFFGCNNSVKEKSYENSVDYGIEKMTSSINEARERFGKRCRLIKDKIEKADYQSKVENINGIVHETDNFINSLKNKIGSGKDFSSEEDLANVKNLLFDRGYGDSLYKRMKKFYFILNGNVLNRALVDTIKGSENSLHLNTDLDEWKNSLFKFQSSYSVQMILYANQLELFEIGGTALSD